MEIEDEILVNHDDLVDHLGKVKVKSDDIKSRGGELRKFSGQFNDDNGYNTKAKNMLLSLHNMPDEKRDDCLRTLLPGLRSMLPHWAGQTTADMFDDSGSAPTMDDSSADQESGEDTDGDDDFDPVNEAVSNVQPFDPDIQAESDEFDAAADEAMAG